MTTSNVSQPPTTPQSLTFEHALSRAASLYEGHVDQARLGKAVEIARNGGITCHDDGTATVQGRTRAYTINGTCDCPDARVHGKYCKHVMAVELTRLAQHHRKAQDRARQPSPAIPPVPPEAPTQPWDCAQAPSSCTLKWEVGGIELMLTLRDRTDQRLFTRIGAILPRLKATVAAERQQRRDAAQQRQADAAAAAQATAGTAATPPQAPAPDDDAHFCLTHEVPFTRHTKGNHVWYSHWDDASQQWCRERR
jgi:hypothetical protein